MKMERPSLPGVEKLKFYLATKGVSATAFCRENRLNGSEISKLLRGIRYRVSVDLAGKIEKATQGYVAWWSWITDEHLRAFVEPSDG